MGGVVVEATEYLSLSLEQVCLVAIAVTSRGYRIVIAGLSGLGGSVALLTKQYYV